MRKYAYPKKLVRELNKKFPTADGLAAKLERGESYAPTLSAMRVYVGDRDILDVNPDDPSTVRALQNHAALNVMIDSYLAELNLIPYTDDSPPCPACKRSHLTPVDDGKHLACPGCGHVAEAA